MEEPGTVQQVGTEINAELVDSIAQDLARVDVQVDDGSHTVSETLSLVGFFGINYEQYKNHSGRYV